MHSLISVLVFSAFLQADAEGAAEKKPTAFLGVQLGKVTPALAAHLGIDGGALIASVAPGSPAEAAGLRAHDVVTSAGGKSVKSPGDLVGMVRENRPDDTLELEIRRGTETVKVSATLGSLPPEGQLAPTPPPATGPGFLGVRFGPVAPDLAAHLGLEAGEGVFVEGVLDDSAAAAAGIYRYDVIVGVDGEKIRDPGDLPAALRGRQEGDRVRLGCIHRGKLEELEVILGARPAPDPEILPAPPRPRGRVFPVPDPWKGRLPRHSLRGKLYWKDAEGEERVFEFPEFDFPDPESFGRELQERLRESFKDFPEDLHDRVEKLFRRYEFNLEDLERPYRRSHSSSVHVSTMVEDGLAITVRQEDGRRTVSVKRDGEVLADNLPFEKIDTLPEEIQEKVRKASARMPEWKKAEEKDPDEKEEKDLPAARGVLKV